MQEKKNKQRLILLVILVMITAAVYWFGRTEKPVVAKDYFKTFDLKTIDRVEMISNGQSVVLSTDGGRWKVDGRYPASSDLVDVLFATLQAAEPRRPVSAALNDSIFDALQKTGVVVVLSSHGTEVERFLAGGNAAKTQAYFSKPSEKKVYVMAIPGYRVYVSGIFESTALGWRSTRIFDFNWQNFKDLRVSFPDAAATGNFEVVMQDFQVAIPGIASPDTAKVNSFLDAVSLLEADYYIEKSTSLDSLLSVQPIETLIVRDIADREYSLSIYPYKKEGAAALVNKADWVFIDSRKTRQIVHPKQFFVSH